MNQSLTSRLLAGRSSKVLTSRRGTIVLGIAAALLAAIVLIVYLNRYRQSLAAKSQPTPVLVAQKLITKGTSVNVLGTQGLFQLQTVPAEHAKLGAVADPDVLKGRIAVADVYPGQQLTLADFSATTTNAIPTRITGQERGVAISVDTHHGLVGHLAAGDHVDVWVGITGPGGQPAIKLLLPDVLVLASPGAADGGVGATPSSTYVLRVTSAEAGELAFATDHGTIWLVARPANGAKPTQDAVVTAQTLLAKKRTG